MFGPHWEESVKFSKGDMNKRSKLVEQSVFGTPNEGMIPRAVRDLFKNMGAKRS